MQFSHVEIIPENIHQAIILHTSHIHQMIISYNSLCFAAKENILNKPLPKNDEFEKLIKDAFNGIDSITSIGFIEYVEKFILDTSDGLLLEKVYNVLTEKMNELIRQPKRLRLNPVYPHYNSLFENTASKMILYLMPLGHELDANGNYKEVKDYFTANNLFDAIVQDLKETKHKVDSLFTLKKLNEKTQISAVNTQPESIQKIDWKKEERLIPFLIHLLNEKGFLNEKNQFAFIEKHFTVNGKPVKRESIKANYNLADYLNKPHKKTPKEIKELTDIVERLNDILNTIE